MYGTSTGSSNAEKAAGCKDIKVLVPVGPVHRTSFTSTVNSIKASGYTPIGESLRRAAAALPAEGPRSIVLVSDGEDTCAPPEPCAVARQLHKKGVDLVVHTGFKVGATARAQLQCIAAATGGSYRDARDGSGLTRQLEKQVSRALRGYQTEGRPVSGSDNAGDGPRLAPGQYVDTYAGVDATSHERTKYYTADPPRGSTPYFSATVVPPARRVSDDGTLRLQVSIAPPDEPACEVSGFGGDIGIHGTVSATTALATPTSDSDRRCLGDGPLTVTVTRSGQAFADESMKVEMSYRVEPPADASAVPGPATAQPDAHAGASGASTPVDSGSSYNDAPRIGSGVYRDTFVSGEQRYVRVHLDWGQRLAFSMTPTKLPGLGILDGVAGQVAVANPVREEVGLADDATASDAFLGSTTNPLAGSTKVPVRYTDRDSDTDDIKGYSLAGDCYLVLSTKFTAAGKPSLTVPYTLRVSVVGRAERDRCTGRPRTRAHRGARPPVIVRGRLRPDLVPARANPTARSRPSWSAASARPGCSLGQRSGSPYVVAADCCDRAHLGLRSCLA